MKRILSIVAVVLIGLMSMPLISADELNVTLSCSPVYVTAIYNSFSGVNLAAETVCSGVIVSPPNVTLPRQSGNYWTTVNMTGPIRYTYGQVTIMNTSKITASQIPVKIKIYSSSGVLKLIKWKLQGEDATHISMNVYSWGKIKPVAGSNCTVGITLKGHWRGVLPIKVDWFKVLIEGILYMTILIDIALGLIGGSRINDKKLGGSLAAIGILMGYISSLSLMFGPTNMLGLFIILETFYLAVWLSLINRTSTSTPAKRRLIGNAILGIFAFAIIFAFIWAVKTNNSFFAFGSLVLVLPPGMYIIHNISERLDDIEAVEGVSKLNPKPFGVTLLMPYLPSILLWGGILESFKTSLFITMVFAGSIALGIIVFRFLSQKDNIHEPANLH